MFTEVEIQAHYRILSNNFLGILRKLQVNYFSKTSSYIEVDGRVALFIVELYK